MRRNIALVLTALFVFTACGGELGSGRTVEVSPQEAANSWALFASVLTDRSDITTGDFERTPYIGDAWILESDAVITATAQRKISDDGRTVTADGRYRLEIADLSELLPVVVSIETDDGDVDLSVNIQVLNVAADIDADTGEALADLSDGTHTLTVRIPNIDYVGRGAQVYGSGDPYLYRSGWYGYGDPLFADDSVTYLEIGELDNVEDVLSRARLGAAADAFDATRTYYTDRGLDTENADAATAAHTAVLEQPLSDFANSVVYVLPVIIEKVDDITIKYTNE